MSVSQQTGAPMFGPEAGTGRAAELRRLVLAHQGGDTDAFSALVRMTFPSMYSHARRRLFDTRAAEDAVQEALLRAYRALPALNGEYQVAAWLHRIVANVCNDEGNRRRRETMVSNRLSVERDEPSPSAEDATGRSEVSRTVAAAIATLPNNYREALVLRDILELEYADVATRAGITEDNARARVHRARAALRRLVDSSVVLGGTWFGGLRRLGRASVEATQHVSTSVSTTISTLPADALAAPSRVSAAATSVAAAAAIAVAAAVPVFTSGNTSTAPASQPSANAYRLTAGPDPSSTVIAQTAAGATPVVAEPTTSTTSTTLEAVGKGSPVGAAPGAAIAVWPLPASAPPSAGTGQTASRARLAATVQVSGTHTFNLNGAGALAGVGPTPSDGTVDGSMTGPDAAGCP
jgi:RNA polymerase sigma-70 factor (ECF subfamily)